MTKFYRSGHAPVSVTRHIPKHSPVQNPLVIPTPERSHFNTPCHSDAGAKRRRRNLLFQPPPAPLAPTAPRKCPTLRPQCQQHGHRSPRLPHPAPRTSRRRIRQRTPPPGATRQIRPRPRRLHGCISRPTKAGSITESQHSNLRRDARIRPSAQHRNAHTRQPDKCGESRPRLSRRPRTTRAAAHRHRSQSKRKLPKPQPESRH
jgi:hypothetical protein